MTFKDVNIIAAVPDAAWQVYLDGWTYGYAEGIEHGRRQAEDEMAALHRAGAAVVGAMVRLPVRDAEDDRAAARRREARWSA